MTATTLDVGDPLPRVEHVLDRDRVRRFAQVAGVASPRFESDGGARAEGLPGQIVPGNFSAGLLARLPVESVPGSRLERISVMFRALVLAGETATCHGYVTNREEDADGVVLECDLVLEAGGERKATGTATLRLPGAR